MLSPFCMTVGVFTSQNTVQKQQEANSVAHSDGVALFILHYSKDLAEMFKEAVLPCWQPLVMARME